MVIETIVVFNIFVVWFEMETMLVFIFSVLVGNGD